MFWSLPLSLRRFLLEAPGLFALPDPNMAMPDWASGMLLAFMCLVLFVLVVLLYGRLRQSFTAGVEVRPGHLGLAFDSEPQGSDRLRIARIVPGSWADTRGLRAGDEVLKINGRPVNGISAADFAVVMQERPLRLRVLRAANGNTDTSVLCWLCSSFVSLLRGHRGEVIASRIAFIALGFLIARACYAQAIFATRDDSHIKTWWDTLWIAAKRAWDTAFKHNVARHGSPDFCALLFFSSAYIYLCAGYASRTHAKIFQSLLMASSAILLVVYSVYLLGPDRQDGSCPTDEGTCTLFFYYFPCLVIIIIWRRLQVWCLLRRSTNEGETFLAPRDLSRQDSCEGDSLSSDQITRDSFAYKDLAAFEPKPKARDLLDASSWETEAEALMTEVKARGAMLRKYAAELERCRIRWLALTILWNTKLRQFKHAKATALLRCVLFVCFWFTSLLLLFGIVAAPLAFVLERNPQNVCLAVFCLGSSFILILNCYDSVQNWSANALRQARSREWLEATKGFVGKERNVCVVSMSGRSEEFWFGVKGACKEVGIGFACLFMRDWGDEWFTRWQQNVRDYGLNRQVPLIVLVDRELQNDTRNEGRRKSCFGTAQQVEVLWLQRQGYDFETVTNEEFVKYLQLKRVCVTHDLRSVRQVLNEQDLNASTISIVSELSESLY